MIKIYFDGACGPKNPGGVGTWGAVIVDVNGKVTELKGVIENGAPLTNNWAEYSGVIEAFKYLRKMRSNLPQIQVYGDSQLVINMAKKVWGWKKGIYNPHSDKPHLAKLLYELQELTKDLMVIYDWIPREKNMKADRLSKEAYTEYKIEKSKKKKEGISQNKKVVALELDTFLRKDIKMKDLWGYDDIDKVGDPILTLEGDYAEKHWIITIKSQDK